jgi:hypothetical protein
LTGKALQTAGSAALKAGEGLLSGESVGDALKDAGTAAVGSLEKSATDGVKKLETDAVKDAKDEVAKVTKKRL